MCGPPTLLEVLFYEGWVPKSTCSSKDKDLGLAPFQAVHVHDRDPEVGLAWRVPQNVHGGGGWAGVGWGLQSRRGWRASRRWTASG